MEPVGGDTFEQKLEKILRDGRCTKRLKECAEDMMKGNRPPPGQSILSALFGAQFVGRS